MNTYKTLIIEDDEILRKGLYQMLQLYAPQLEILGEADTVSLAVEQLIKLQPDVVFLDIMLIGGTGFDVLEQYQAKMGKPHFQIVFITAFEEYAIKAFRMSALDYLLKPIDPDELKEVIAKIEKSKTQNQEVLELLSTHLNRQNAVKKIALNTAEGIHIISIDTIVFVQADNNYTIFHVQNQKTILVSKPLKEYDELLSDKGFVRVHQSYLVNENFVQYYNKSDQSLLLTNDSKIPVASRKKEMVLQVLTKMIR